MAEQWRDRDWRARAESWRRPQRYAPGEGERYGALSAEHEEERLDAERRAYERREEERTADYGRHPYGRSHAAEEAARERAGYRREGDPGYGEAGRYGERLGPGGYGAFPGGGYGADRGWSDYGEGRRRAQREREEERDWWDRASDEVSSWFGDEAAAHRRELDRGHRGRGPKGYVRSDERIREDVSDRLADDRHLDASELEVAVSGCEVTLSGTVASREEKRRAEDLADSVSGVRHVQNNLRVKPPGTAPLGTATTAFGAGATLGSAGGNGNSQPGGKRSGL